MWKKHEKVDLTSHFYRSKKTPEKQKTYNSRSPKVDSKREQQASADKVDPNALFQKVCCPNCRYIFKIIKNMDVLRSSTPKKRTVHQVSVQTENSPLKTSKITVKVGNEEPAIDTSRKSTSSIFKTTLAKQNTLNRSVTNSQVDHLKSSTFQFPQRSPLKKNKSVKKRNVTEQDSRAEHLLKEPSNKSIAQSGVEKKQDGNQRSSLDQTSRELIEKLVRQEVRKDLEELPSILSSELKNSKAVAHLTSFYSDLPSSIQIPSYMKMLIKDNSQAAPQRLQSYVLRQN